MNNAISLVGIMGSGKTSIAKKLAKKLNLECIDTDLEIKNITGLSVFDLIKTEQIELLDSTEYKIIEEYSNKNYVISTGDNTVNNHKAWQFLMQNTITIWINISLQRILERLKPNENRPLLNTEEIFVLKNLKSLYLKRKTYYQQSQIEICNFRKDSINKLINILNSKIQKKIVIK